jgi:hypothetical protein
MQKRQVLRVDVALIALQVVAGMVDLGGPGLFRWAGHEREIGDAGRLSGAHVGQDQPAGFVTRIGGVTDLILVVARRWLARLLEATPIAGDQPAVVDATQAALVEPTVTQIDAAVRAITANQPRPAARVPEQNQVFAEDTRRHRRVGRKLLGQSDRLPIAPHQLAAWRPASVSVMRSFCSLRHGVPPGCPA